MKPTHRYNTKDFIMLTTIITYTKPEKDIQYLREDDIKEDMDLAVSLEDSLL
jgi:hypothetical protein